MIKKPIKNVLFGCFGNSSRSPLALGLAIWLKNTKYKEELKNVNFDSAGFVNVFKTAQPETIEYLKTKNVDFSSFRGKLVTDELLMKQDLILFMEDSHLKRLKRKFKQIKDIDKKSFILLNFAGEKGDLNIPDPVNFSQEVYDKVIRQVENGVIKSIKRIIKINNGEEQFN